MSEASLAAIWGAIAGGAISIIINALSPIYKKFHMSKNINLKNLPVDAELSRCRVVNNSWFTIKNAKVYIWLKFVKDDTLQKGKTFIRPDNFIPLEGDQLCWQTRVPTINPDKVDIYVQDHQDFGPCRIFEDYIVIPSEEGWEGEKRVYLKKKVYSGFLKVVSEDTWARYFEIAIDPTRKQNPLTIEKMPIFHGFKLAEPPVN
jgi:hypothetical protein